MFRKICLVSVFAIAVAAILSTVNWVGGVSNDAWAIEGGAPGNASVNPFHGTYEGGFWSNDIPGVGPFGGDVKCTVTSAGAVKLTFPGTGTGTVSPTGAFKVSGKLNFDGEPTPITYTGNVMTVTAGAKNIAIGFGTWSAPAIPAKGKWEVHRSLMTP